MQPLLPPLSAFWCCGARRSPRQQERQAAPAHRGVHHPHPPLPPRRACDHAAPPLPPPAACHLLGLANPTTCTSPHHHAGGGRLGATVLLAAQDITGLQQLGTAGGRGKRLAERAACRSTAAMCCTQRAAASRAAATACSCRCWLQASKHAPTACAAGAAGRLWCCILG